MIESKRALIESEPSKNIKEEIKRILLFKEDNSY